MSLGLVKKATDPFKSERARVDYELYEKWKDGGQRPDDLRPLLRQFRPLIRKWSNKYAGPTRDVEMPPAAIHAEFDRWFLHALDTYDPNKGAALGTWVDHNLQKGQRWVMNHRNLARVVESRTYKDVGAYKNAVSVLDDQFGRPPNTQEVSEYLGWPEKKTALVQSEIHPTLSSSYWERSESSVDPTTIMPSRHSEVLTNIQYQLSPEELSVYEYLLGRNGKPKLKQNEIADKLGFSQSKVSRLKNNIGKKMAEYF